ncbi:hypothetical protein GFS24_09465 [Chitinophaga sp. SYP-B3965]|uniref:hypothetical protein n=1 Tax=Chitinophaga sp. SYP-B3965 TaxID=2663120 RepID=UPI001299DE85|nr:hypothetical protein [Chitinophaga sp. SYP-B3965]MRG45344.1 hypothetical protein [Chitinophaga sp. SYP-B3965]
MPDQSKWEELSAFNIYPLVEVSTFQKLSDADIQKLPFKSADVKEAKKLLSSARMQFSPILWKGMGRLVIIKFKDGSSRKILLTTYRSSFRDVTGNRNYTLEGNAAVWNSFISKNNP